MESVLQITPAQNQLGLCRGGRVGSRKRHCPQAHHRIIKLGIGGEEGEVSQRQRQRQQGLTLWNHAGNESSQGWHPVDWKVLISASILGGVERTAPTKSGAILA